MKSFALTALAGLASASYTHMEPHPEYLEYLSKFGKIYSTVEEFTYRMN